MGTQALLKEVGEAREGCIISQGVNFPWDDSVPLVKEYLAALKEFQLTAKIRFVSFEGYIVGKLFCEAAKATRGSP